MKKYKIIGFFIIIFLFILWYQRQGTLNSITYAIVNGKVYGTCLKPIEPGRDELIEDCVLIPEADAATFKEYPQVAEGRVVYAKDKNNVYFHTGVLSDANPKMFKPIFWYYAADDKFVYYHGEKIPNADPETWEYIDETYSKDSKYVYYENQVISGAEVGSFSIVNNDWSGEWSYDHDSMFYCAEKVSFYQVDFTKQALYEFKDVQHESFERIYSVIWTDTC